jgi:hypothetical protein
MKAINGKRLKTNGCKIRYSCTNYKVILSNTIYVRRTNNRNYGAGGGFAIGKADGARCWSSSPSSAEVKKEWKDA